MKTPATFLTLALAVVSCGWFWKRHKEHSALSLEVGHLRESLAQPASPPVPESSNRKPTQSALEGRPVNWNAVAGEFQQYELIGGMINTNAHLRALFEDMSVAELWAAFEELNSADLGKAERQILEGQFLEILLRKDTERAFNTFAVREHR